MDKQELVKEAINIEPSIDRFLLDDDLTKQPN